MIDNYLCYREVLLIPINQLLLELCLEVYQTMQEAMFALWNFLP